MFLALAILIIPLFFMAYVKELRDSKTKKINELISDYSGLVSKLTLLYGAGLTLYNALTKICSDYEHSTEFNADRHFYRELKYTCVRIKNGSSESYEYKQFGKRCEALCYVKLGSILSRSLVKGSEDMVYLLKSEVIRAYEEEKQYVLKKGGEAGTKLLLPMIMIFAVIMILIIVPAFSSVGLTN